MTCRGFVVFVCVLCLCSVKGFPHQSTEESDDSAETPDTEVVVVVPVTSHHGDSASTETSHESHETKSREEEDKGSVSESDETKMADGEPNIHEDVAKFAEDNSKMADEEARGSVYQSKLGEGASKMIQNAAKMGGDATKTAASAAKMTEDAVKMSVDKLDDSVQKSIEDLAKLGDKETRSPAFRPKVIDVEKMAEVAEVEATGTKVAEDKGKEEAAKGGEDDGKGTEEDESDEDGGGAKFPKAGSCPICPKGAAAVDKTESLCPARPEEITKIEAECAEEYRQWKAMRAKKFAQQTAVEKTTEATTTTTVATTEASTTTTTTAATTEALTEAAKLLEINVDESEVETTTNEIADQIQESTVPTSETTTSHDDLQATSTPVEAEDELPTVEATMTTTTTTTTTAEMESWVMGRKRRSSRKVTKKRSCYPATCILRKLNLLDSMGQPSIERIQSFAINMTVDDKTNLEQKAVGCVKEINEAMIDASADIGKKVGCVAQKVISCLNKGLMCPIMKVPQ